MRIDAHVHFLPPALQDSLQEFAEQEPFWGMLLYPGGRISKVQGWRSIEQMLEDMDRAGVDRVVVQSEYRREHAACIERNNQAIDLVRRFPNQISAFACIQPAAGEEAVDELKRCLDHGLAGVGELHPYGQGFRFTDQGFLQLAEYCAREAVPLNLHANESVGHYYPGKSPFPIREYYALAERFPSLRLILAHWGGGLFFYEIMPEVRKVLANVVYDTAASPLLYPTSEIFPIALQIVGAHKILYGSDYPLRLYPRRKGGPDFTSFLDEIHALGLGTAQEEAVLGGNMQRILNERAAGSPVFDREATSPVDVDIQEIQAGMPLRAVVSRFPETRDVFARYGIPWSDNPVPSWEPIEQAACARGFAAAKLQRLLDDLNAAIS